MFCRISIDISISFRFYFLLQRNAWFPNTELVWKCIICKKCTVHIDNGMLCFCMRFKTIFFLNCVISKVTVNIKHCFNETNANTKKNTKFLKSCVAVDEWLWIPDKTCISVLCIWWKWTCFKYSSFIIIEFRHWEEIYCYTKNGWLLYRHNKI